LAWDVALLAYIRAFITRSTASNAEY